MPDPEDEQDPNTLIEAIQAVMRPGGWLSGPCPSPQSVEDDDDEDDE